MTQLEKSRALARALARYDKAVAELVAARTAVDTAFAPWAAGRATNRDEAREQLVAVGLLPPKVQQ